MTDADGQNEGDYFWPKSTGVKSFWVRIGITGVALAIVGGVLVYLMQDQVSLPRTPKERDDLESLRTQLLAYETMNGQLPSTEQGLMALVQRPTSDPQPRRWVKFMSEVPLDPWGMPYQYQYPASRSSKDGYDLYSMGKDRTANTEDDIGNW